MKKIRINSLQLKNNVLLLHSQKLSYGVMVTQQILVLSFQVRVLVAQPEKRDFRGSLFFIHIRNNEVFVMLIRVKHLWTLDA